MRPAFLKYVDYLRVLSRDALEKSPKLFGYPMNCKEVQALNMVRQAIPEHVVLNNCLDPFAYEKSHYKVHSMTQERNLVLQLAQPWIDPETSVWGYVTTGGTEGNLKGLRTGLERSSKKKLILLSDDAHFSVEKAARISGEQYCKIRSKANGCMDIEDLAKVIEIGKRCGAEQLVIMATLGTTFKGASDDLTAILDQAQEFYRRSNIYMHVDGAFAGGYWYHNDDAIDYKLGEDFDSFSVSGHKFFGGFVAGCFFTVDSTFIKTTPVGYLGFDDRIASGSRNGMLPMLWLARLEQFDWKQEYISSRKNVEYLESRFKDLNVPCFSHPGSLIIIFPEPSSHVCDYYQLATLNNWAHICMLPHITRQEIDEFIDMLTKNGDIKTMANMEYSKDNTGWPITN